MESYITKKTLVKLTNDEFYEGTLISIDGAFNIYLIDTKLINEEEKEKEKENKEIFYKNLFIRGNNVLYIAPYINK